ncbi:MAG: agmatine deiminase family protein [Eubacteriaceae bacterium]
MNRHYDYTMPAEWENHERTFIQWPVKDSLIYPENYKEVCNGYAQVINAISQFEPVTIIVNEDITNPAEILCNDSIEIIKIPHNDAWIRDNGPTFVINNQNKIAGINWEFNAWGEKYIPYDLDAKVASKLLSHFHITCYDVPMVLEGGSIHVDGEGTLLTTEECLLNPNRNPNLSKNQIEDILKEYLNVTKIIWLKNGLFGDETNGHIDNIACFVRPGVVMLQTCYNKEDPNYQITLKSIDILQKSIDAKGRKLRIIEMPQPPIRYYKDTRLTLSYLNFYFVNGGILLPVFGGDAIETDKRAENILHDLFPHYEIVNIDGMALIKEGGNIHCITQQMPLTKH